MNHHENLAEARYIGGLILVWAAVFVYLLWDFWSRAV